MATTNGGDRTHSGRARDSTSPLGGIAYDWRALRLHEYVESPVDREVRRFLVAYERLTDDERAEARSAMSVDEFETLVAFAQRSVVASVRASNPAAVSEGLFALTAIDQQRVDYRDVTLAAALVSWAMVQLMPDAAGRFRHAAEYAEPGVAATLSRFADAPVSDLAPWGHWLITTSRGPGLASAHGTRFEPTIDLVQRAVHVGDVLENDVYRVIDLTVAAELPSVWLGIHDARSVRAPLSAYVCG